MLDIKRVLASAPKKPEQVDLRKLATPWSNSTTKADSEQLHPHPQFAREQFQLLDGWWDYCIVPSSNASTAWKTDPLPSEWEGHILVPFSPEASLSGIGRQLMPNELLWYRRSFAKPDVTATTPNSRCILHFEAVDYACACYCNNTLVGTHVGGYLPFAFDVTDALIEGENEIALCVYDPSDTGVQLSGKQKLERGGIWYTAQSGIWQTVWYEIVPEAHIRSAKIEPNADEQKLDLTVSLHASKQANGSTSPALGTTLEITLLDQGAVVGRASAETTKETHTFTIDVPNPHLWNTTDPHLYQLELTYANDTVTSYCAFRTVTIEQDEQGVRRLYLNHEPCFLRGVLDQGYWSDGLMTAPSDEALIYDIETMRDLGFNMLRKHIKVESDRWYYHCDRLGMLVWQDMVNGGSTPKPWYTNYMPTFLRWSWGHYNDGPRHYHNLSSDPQEFRDEWTQTCIGTIDHLRNHPSIITWVLFNEAWGQFDAQEATDCVRALDPTRPIDAVSGWYDQQCGDFLSVHNYFRPLEVYKDAMRPPRAFVISEFGGLSYHVSEHSSLATSYGYATYSDGEAYRTAMQDILAQADELEKQGLAGFVYTQLSDIEEETNGILTYDRQKNKLSKRDGV